MIIKLGLPVASLVLLAASILYVAESAEQDILQEPPVQPSSSPFVQTVSAAGLIEAQTENIELGAPVSGVVTDVFVKVGQRVDKWDPLFRLDDRQLQSEAQTRRADRARARADYEHLIAGPRVEEIAIAEADLARATARLQYLKDQLQRVDRLYKEKVVTEQSHIQQQKEAEMAAADVQQAEAKLELLRNGASETEKSLAAAEVQRAEARLNETLAALERLTVRARESATILEINVHRGEFVGAPAQQALVVMGNVDTLHVRVDIDELEIPRFRAGSAANAFLKGHPDRAFPLRFVRVEQRVIPKRSLTGYGNERVDTRVLQVIYALNPAAGEQLFVGQQVDVYVDAARPAASQDSREVEHQELCANGRD